tara:strand:- start:2436 stop:2702 length:267 start_codon:yes stop_codon:yes gene_type:complete
MDNTENKMKPADYIGKIFKVKDMKWYYRAYDIINNFKVDFDQDYQVLIRLKLISGDEGYKYQYYDESLSEMDNYKLISEDEWILIGIN